MTKFETTDYAQMRRCRMAHLHGQRVDERFEGGINASGFIHAIRPDLTCWPLRWSITLQQHTADAELALHD